jgi:hypothetical protein
MNSSVSDPHWLYADTDPESGKIWRKFSEGKQSFCFHLIFSYKTFLDQVLCLKYDWIENTGTNFEKIFWSTDLTLLFWADFPLSGSAFAEPDPGANWMRIRIRNIDEKYCISNSN